MRISVIIFSVLFFLSSCGSEPVVEKTKVLEKITETELIFANGETIEIRGEADKDKSIIFLIRPGEYEKRSPSRTFADLTTPGQEYATKIYNLFKPVAIDQVISIGTTYSNNTVKPTAELKDKTIFHYNNLDYGALLDYIFNLEKGKTFLLVETHEKIGEILYTFSGDDKYHEPIAEDDYSKMFLIKAPERTKSEIHSFSF